MRFSGILLLVSCALISAVAPAHAYKPILTAANRTPIIYTTPGTPLQLEYDLNEMVQFVDPDNAMDLYQVQTQLGTFYIQLFPESAPLTVANFVHYIDSGYYDNLIVHRSVPDFVIQTGELYLNNESQINEVYAFSPVANEFGISNTRGTLALAKVDGNPNSGTNNWFINLKDNSPNLDTQNGGFTVFGEVYGNGMEVVDSIAAQPFWNAQSQLGLSNLPLLETFDGFGLLRSKHFIQFQNIGKVSPYTLPVPVNEFTPQYEITDHEDSGFLNYNLSDDGVLTITNSRNTVPSLDSAYVSVRVHDGSNTILEFTLHQIYIHRASKVIVGNIDTTEDFWNESSWLGWYDYSNWPWVYNYEHGWMWISSPTDNGGLWYWDGAIGWVWTSPALYPTLYSINLARWAYYYEGGALDERWFYIYGEILPDILQWAGADWPAMKAGSIHAYLSER